MDLERPFMFIFYEMGGGLLGLGEGSPKKSGLKGGGSKNNQGKGGSHKYFGNTLRWDMFYYS